MTADTPALSIRQPWAWLIVNGFKDIENRDWRTRHRGQILIHAAKTVDHDAVSAIAVNRHPVTGGDLPPALRNAFAGEFQNLFQGGGLVGAVDLIDVVERSDSPWFVGRYGFVLAKPRPFRRFYPMRGTPGLFSVADFA